MGDSWGLGGATALSLFATPAAEALDPAHRGLARRPVAGADGAAPHRRRRGPRAAAAAVAGAARARRTGATCRCSSSPSSSPSTSHGSTTASATGGAAPSATPCSTPPSWSTWPSGCRGCGRRSTAIFGADAWPEVELEPTSRVYGLMDEFVRAVARLDRLDPVTTELVRLRGARQHGCRVCMSRAQRRRAGRWRRRRDVRATSTTTASATSSPPSRPRSPSPTR